MKKDLIKKFIIISLISIMFTMIVSINTVQATNSNSENFIADETSEAEEKIMMYDAENDTTTEIDMEALRKSISRQKTSSNSVEPYNMPSKAIFSRAVDTYATYSNSMQRITNTSAFPNKATCKIMESAGQKTIGTAALVGPKVALTAAHCVFDTKTKETIKNWTILPGYNQGDWYGTETGWSKVIYSSKWMSSGSNGDARYDWAICILGHNLGNEVGCWYGVTSYGSNTTDFKKLDVRVLGYPAEDNSMTTGEYQYQTGGAVKSVNDTNFTYDGWTVRGFSGGPIRRTNDNYIVGVHYGVTATNVPNGVRITQEMIDIIRENR